MQDLLREMWDLKDSTEFLVVDPVDMENMANARVKWIMGRVWVYVDDIDGYSLLSNEQVRGLTLEEVSDE